MAQIKLQVTIDGDRVTARRLKTVEKAVKDVGDASVKAGAKSGAFMGTLIGNLTSRAMSLAIFALRDAARAVVDFGVASLKTSGEFEMLKIQMKAVGDAGQSAEATFDGIVRLAEKTPFQIQELAQAFVRLKGAGIQDVPKLLQGTADAVATFGGGTEELKGVALALAQIAAKGTLSGQELRQIAERNIPIYKLLQQSLGVTGDEFEKMRMKGIESGKALAAISEAFTAYAGNAEKAMDTFTGRLSNVRQAWTVMLSEIGDAANEAAKEGFVELEKAIKDVDAEGLGQALADATTAVLEFGVKGVEAINNISEQLEQQRGGWWEIYRIVKLIGDELGKFLDTGPAPDPDRNIPIHDFFAGIREMLTEQSLRGLQYNPMMDLGFNRDNLDEIQAGVTGVGNAWATWPTPEEMGLLGDETDETGEATKRAKQSFESAGEELGKMVKRSKELGEEWKKTFKVSIGSQIEEHLEAVDEAIQQTKDDLEALNEQWEKGNGVITIHAEELDGVKLAMEGISGPEMVDALKQAGASSLAIGEGFASAGAALDADLITWEKFQEIVSKIGTEGFDVHALYKAISEAARSQQLESAVTELTDIFHRAFDGVFSDIFTSILKGEDVDIWEELWQELASIAGETLGATLVDAIAVAFGGKSQNGTIFDFNGANNNDQTQAGTIGARFVAIAGVAAAAASAMGEQQIAATIGGAASGAATGASIASMMSAGSAAGIWGIVIGALVGALMGYFSSSSGPDPQDYFLQFSGASGSFVGTGPEGFQEGVQQANEVWASLRAGYISLLEMFQDPELFGMLNEFDGIFAVLDSSGYADEIQGALRDFINVELPRMMAIIFRDALIEGFANIAGDDLQLQGTLRNFFTAFVNSLGNLPSDAQLEALKDMIEVFLVSFELLSRLEPGAFMEFMQQTEFERRMTALGEGLGSIDVSLAALAELPISEQAGQAEKVLDMITQAADAVSQMMDNILKVSKAINDSIDAASENIQYSALAQGIQFLRDGNIPSYAVADGTILGEIQGQMEQGLFGGITSSIRDLFGEISSAASPEQVQSLTDQAMQQIQLLLQYGQQFGADNEFIQQYLRDFLSEFGIDLTNLGFEFDPAGQYLEGSFTQVIRQLLEQLRGTAQGRLEEMQQALIDINERLVNAIERLIATLLAGYEVGDPRLVDPTRLNPFGRGIDGSGGGSDTGPGLGPLNDDWQQARDQWGESVDGFVFENGKAAASAANFSAVLETSAAKIAAAAALLDSSIGRTVKTQRKVGARRSA